MVCERVPVSALDGRGAVGILCTLDEATELCGCVPRIDLRQGHLSHTGRSGVALVKETIKDLPTAGAEHKSMHLVSLDASVGSGVGKRRRDPAKEF